MRGWSLIGGYGRGPEALMLTSVPVGLAVWPLLDLRMCMIKAKYMCVCACTVGEGVRGPGGEGVCYHPMCGWVILRGGLLLDWVSGPLVSVPENIWTSGV